MVNKSINESINQSNEGKFNRARKCARGALVFYPNCNDVALVQQVTPLLPPLLQRGLSAYLHVILEHLDYLTQARRDKVMWEGDRCPRILQWKHAELNSHVSHA